MATPTFPKLNFSPIKASLVDQVGAHAKNAGPHIGCRLVSMNEAEGGANEENGYGGHDDKNLMEM